MSNTLPLNSLEEQLGKYHEELKDALSIERLAGYMDDPETINEKARKALLPYGPQILIGILNLAFHAKSEQVKLGALKEAKSMVFGDAVVLGGKESELDKFLSRITSNNGDDLPTNEDL